MRTWRRIVRAASGPARHEVKLVRDAGHDEHGKLYDRAARGRSVSFTCFVGKLEFLLQEACAVTGHRRLLFVDAKYLGNVVLVEVKVRDHAQFVEAL